MLKPVKPSHYFTIPVVLVITVMVLTACGSQPATAPATQASASGAAAAAPASTQAATSAPAATESVAQPPAQAGTAVSFSADILPLFQKSCVSCHGGEKTSRALDLKTYASLMTGSQNGAVIVPGEAAASKLVQAIQAGKMPKRGTKWTPEQLQLLVDWVNAGALNN